ncbi:hypothetical protein DFH27DRAFT_613393 [Peziza echinospora]|nr:hypothetical protein DFH27DRAFT_613393 [Peziza echinospora]
MATYPREQTWVATDHHHSKRRRSQKTTTRTSSLRCVATADTQSQTPYAPPSIDDQSQNTPTITPSLRSPAATDSQSQTPHAPPSIVQSPTFRRLLPRTPRDAKATFVFPYQHMRPYFSHPPPNSRPPHQHKARMKPSYTSRKLVQCCT